MIRLKMPPDHNDTGKRFPRQSRDPRPMPRESGWWVVLKVSLFALSAVSMICLFAYLIE